MYGTLLFCCAVLRRVADFSHVAAVLHASGVISAEQAMQPHGERTHSRPSERSVDGTMEGGSRSSAVADGAKDASTAQQAFGFAAPSLVPPAVAAGSVSIPPPPVASIAVGSPSLSDAALPVLRCGVIGSGRNATRLISLLAVTRGCRVVSVLSKNDSRSAALRRQHPTIATVQTDLSAFLSHSEVDAVFIASAVGSVKYGSHHALALACAERRKPTVVDRPFARSASEAREMQVAFERAQVPLLAHQPLRAMPAIGTLQQAIGALQRVTSVSYSFCSPLSSLTAASASSSPSPSPCLPCLPRSLASSGGPLLAFVCDLFDVLECVLGAVSHVSGDAVHLPPSPGSVDSGGCESVLSAAVWDVASSSQEDRLVLRGTGGDLTLPLYQPAMPILQTAQGMKQIAPPHDAPSSEAVQRLVDELRRQMAAVTKSRGSADMERGSAAAAAAAATGGSSDTVSSIGVSGGGSNSGSGVNGGSAAVDVCLVTAAMSVRSLACADAALRSFYRLRTDAYWDRPHTWQSHAWTVPTRPK